MLGNIHISGSVKINGDTNYSDNLIKNISTIKQIIINEIVDYSNMTLAIAMPRCADLISSIIACLDLHIPYMLIDLSLPQSRVQYMIDHANIECTLTLSSIDLSFTVKKKIIIDEKENESDNCDLKPNMLLDNNVAYILYTSGSTGLPKGVMVTHEGLQNFIEAVPKVVPFVAGSRIVSFTSPSFDIFFLETILALHEGVNVIFASDGICNNSRMMVKFLIESEPEMLQITPSRLKMIEVVDPNLTCLKTLKVIMVGGEQFSQNLLVSLQTKTNARIFNMYGPTETTIWSTISELTTSDYVDIGLPIDNTEIFLLDDNLQPVVSGEISEICISGTGLAQGYINDAIQTKNAFTEYAGHRIYRTGDLGRYDNNGKLVYLGRKDSQVKILGHRIELDEIDHCVEKILKIKLSLTCFDEQNERLITFYDGDTSLSEADIKNELAQDLPSHMIPYRIIKTKDFVYSISGKIDRKTQLSRYFSEASSSNDSECKPDRIIQVLKEILDDDSVEITDETLLDSLINSIQYIKLIVNLEENFDIEISNDKLHISSFKTVGDMKKYVQDKTEITLIPRS